jgi:hypothetical protein
MKISSIRFVFGWFLLAFSAFSFGAEPVAMITDLTGNAHLASQKSKEKLALLTYLPAGEVLVLEAGAHMVVTYFEESKDFLFKGPARLTIEKSEVKVVKGAPAVLRKLDQEKSAGAGNFVRSGKLIFAAVEMRSLMLKPTLLSPVNCKISTVTPLFSWNPVGDAESYQLVLTDDAGKILQEAKVTDNNWQLPVDAALQPGMDYHWTLLETLKSGEKATAKASFSILDLDKSASVFAKRPSETAAFSEKVTYALYLESEGLKEDAKLAWRELSAQRPNDPNLKFRAK